ncbi:MAG TPA: hypothetical protein GYA08_18155 [Chloroflexi bacterium]|nr:hypothetical protein [Chloroflexota bacterium]
MFSNHHPLKKTLLLLLLTIVLLANLPLAAQAQTESSPGVTTQILPDGVAIDWSASTVAETSVATLSAILPTARVNGYDLPIHTVTLAAPTGNTPSVIIESLQSTELVGEIAPAPPELPPVLDWTPMPNVGPDETAQLPAAPAFILREGVNKGQRFIVVAISPIFEEAGVVKVATDLRVIVRDATPLAPDALTTVNPAQTQVAVEEVVVPVNQAALQSGYRLTVSQPGIQEVPFSAFGNDFDSMKLHLTHRGETVAVEVLADRFRFYAPTVGDRWNATSVYWLTFDGGGARMNTAVTPTAAAVAGQAFERGVWRNNKQYVSEYPGFDADHWYNASLTVLGSATGGFPAASLPVTPVLPDATGESTYTTNLTVIGQIPLSACQADVKGYKVRADLLDSAGAVLASTVHEWNPAPYSNGRCRLQEDWALNWMTDAKPAAIRLTLLASGVAGYNTSILIDAMQWERPVTLNFGGRGADFWTAAGAADFTLSNLPAARTLYDVTDPDNPIITPLNGAGTSATFTQANSTTPRHYVLANLAALATPTVTAHSAASFGNVLAADAIYIGPAQFREEVQPLLDLRTRQGYTPLFVDVQAIFDVYGYGYVSAPAIRNFLRHRSDWQNPNRIISVVLVGDGTYDPFNYKNTGFGASVSHPIPPYMADVDIYINETPCETCFAQLNGEDPVTGDDPDGRNPKSNVFIPDVWLGRFPVRNEAELATMVAKIVGYETATAPAGWRSSQLLLADNFITSINAQKQVTVDPAGDFAAFSDEVAGLFRYGAGVRRVYYDHSPDRRVDFTTSTGTGLYNTVSRTNPEPWRIASIPGAKQLAIDNINAGVGLMIYNGHSHHWQFAYLEDQSGTPAAPLLSIVDVPMLTNGDKLFVGLSMTCLTSQFAAPAVTGTLDELFVRSATGGAVATWGPSGQSVAHGHDYLQKGFVNKLRNSPPDSQRLGELVTAGYNNLLTSPLTGSLDALKTFVLLGDPLTVMRANVGFDNGVFLPAMQR